MYFTGMHCGVCRATAAKARVFIHRTKNIDCITLVPFICLFSCHICRTPWNGVLEKLVFHKRINVLLLKCRHRKSCRVTANPSHWPFISVYFHTWTAP